VSRALWLAGRALDRADWRRHATDALAAALLTPRQVVDHSLCHGTAGLLRITARMAADSGDERLAARLPMLAGALLAGYDAEAPFGYRQPRSVAGAAGPAEVPARSSNRAGFLDGAAGIALALHGYATGLPPATPWDAALLLV
jgi:hypothetical protein